MNKKKMVVMGIVPLAVVVLLLFSGAGEASFLAGIVLVFTIEAIWNRAEKKKGARRKKEGGTAMKKTFLVVLLFSLSFTQPAKAGSGGGGFSGATEYTQILNNVQLADSYAQQVMQYQNQLLQYDTMLKNLAEHPVGNITPSLNALVSNQSRVMSGTQNIGSSMSAVNQNFATQFESPVASSYAERFNGWTDHSNDALKTAMRNSGLQRENFESDEEAMKALVEKNHSSGGNLAAIKTVGEINAAQLQESMKLRDLISRQQDAQNIYLATQNKKSQDTKEQNDKLMRFQKMEMPSNK